MSYQTKRLDERVIEILMNGGVGFMPSDTIYGLSCRALDETAVERIYRLKKRDSNKPLIILIATISQLQQLGINESEAKLGQEYWPGPLTLICKTTNTPVWLHRGTSTLAIRWPSYPELCQIITQTGPIVSTSANTQGQDPINTVQKGQEAFGEQLDFYVDVGDLSSNQSSTLVRSVNGKLEVIRAGAVKIGGN